MWWELARIVLVMAMLIVAGLLCTPKGRLPLALRGLKKLLKKDGHDFAPEEEKVVPSNRKFIAFIIVLAAAAIALLR